MNKISFRYRWFASLPVFFTSLGVLSLFLLPGCRSSKTPTPITPLTGATASQEGTDRPEEFSNATTTVGQVETFPAPAFPSEFPPITSSTAALLQPVEMLSQTDARLIDALGGIHCQVLNSRAFRMRMRLHSSHPGFAVAPRHRVTGVRIG